jgi:hypothetical protein
VPNEIKSKDEVEAVGECSIFEVQQMQSASLALETCPITTVPPNDAQPLCLVAKKTPDEECVDDPMVNQLASSAA